jgi:Dit-like tail protein
MSSALAITASLGQLALIAGQSRSLRSVGGIVAQVVIDENHVDELEITNHPVEQGASITDHAFKLPSQLTLRYGWSSSPSPQPGLKGLIPSVLPVQAQSIYDIYNKLLTMQVNRELLTVYTGKRAYRNMLIQRIEQDTDQNSENSLPLTIALQELLLVSTTTASTGGVGAASDSSKVTYLPTYPTEHGGTFQLLPASDFNSGG